MRSELTALTPEELTLLAQARERSRAIGQQLRQKQWTLAVAESCTGGLLAAQIVAIAGSSDYFLGGVVAYANEVKAGVLGVAASTLAAYGAVSWQTAVEMAWGARTLLGADLALATTGIAGPTGGTAEKPVGLVYIALATPERLWWERHRWSGSRGENNLQSVLAALRLLGRYLEDPLSVPAEGTSGEYGSLAVPRPTAGEEISIEVSTTEAGDKKLPRAFTWHGQRVMVTSWGRTWTDKEGQEHFLVMSAEGSAFELAWDPASGRWHVLRAWPKPSLA